MTSRQNQLRLTKPGWWQPVAAAVLAAASVGISLYGFQTVTEKPQYPLNIVFDEPFDDDLGVGISPESVQALAEGHYVYEPFTFRVVSRELEFSEFVDGEIQDADALLSTQLERPDPDESIEDNDWISLSWAAQNNIAFADPDVPYNDRRDVERVFTNNLSLGHGPSAVVGAAITAGDLQFSGAPRTPLFWAPLAGLPLVTGIALMWFWQRARGQFRQAQDRFSANKLTLARVVLELDALEVRYIAARDALTEADDHHSGQADALGGDWENIHRSSLQLARIEQELEKLFAGRATGWDTDDTLLDFAPDSPQLKIVPPHPGGTRAFTHFEQETIALKERADALAAASELQAGHASSQSVLDRLALPLIQAIDELIGWDRQRPGLADMLRPHRESLLAISVGAQDASSAADGEEPDDDEAKAQQLVADQAELMQRWDETEQLLLEDLSRWRQELPSEYFAEGSIEERTAERVRARIRSLTSGEHESFDALRRTLGLGYGLGSGPLYATERCLELLDGARRNREFAETRPGAEDANWWTQGSTLAVAVPLVIALGAGLIASSMVQTTGRYGAVLEGDQELASIDVIGDVSSLALPEGSARARDGVTQEDTVELDFIRESMERGTRNNTRALLPEALDLTVVIRPVDDYMDYWIDTEPGMDALTFDYFQLLTALTEIKHEVAELNPEVINPETFEIAQGQALQPVWVLADGRYGVSAPLTGDLSTGVDSRLGARDLQYTRLFLRDADHSLMLGDDITNDLLDLGQAMENNHQEAQQVSGFQVFWMTALTVWGGIQMVLIIGASMLGHVMRRFGSFAAQRQLEQLHAQLKELSLDLDLSRLDMVAVLGGDSRTEGRAEEADQRLYEAGLVTALREVQALERLPRRQKRGEQWVSRVEDAQQLIDSLSARDRRASERAEELLNSQRRR